MPNIIAKLYNFSYFTYPCIGSHPYTYVLGIKTGLHLFHSLCLISVFPSGPFRHIIMDYFIFVLLRLYPGLLTFQASTLSQPDDLTPGLTEKVINKS